MGSSLLPGLQSSVGDIAGSYRGTSWLPHCNQSELRGVWDALGMPVPGAGLGKMAAHRAGS